MKDFDQRWQSCVSQARQAPRRDTTPPFGFTGRVVALAWDRKSAMEEDVWGSLALRLLVASLPILLLCAVLEAPYLRGPRSLETGVENAVAQLVWRL